MIPEGYQWSCEPCKAQPMPGKSPSCRERIQNPAPVSSPFIPFPKVNWKSKLCWDPQFSILGFVAKPKSCWDVVCVMPEMISV